MHHQLFNGNYALYFTWWDKWMGTEFKDYETRHAQIFERKNIKDLNSLTLPEQDSWSIKEQINESATLRNSQK
jgi:sterol desaturase/sphingolipid hydroxylase (fatty acid hydroxylase superfamily)